MALNTWKIKGGNPTSCAAPFLPATRHLDFSTVKPNRIDWTSCVLIIFDLKIILHQVFSSIRSLPQVRQRRQLQA